MLMGVNGAGKTTLAPLIAQTLDVPCILDCEERAFSRELAIGVDKSDKQLHRRIVEHCKSMADAWKNDPADVVIVDRFYETYVTESGIGPTEINEIEEYIQSCGLHGLWINLVLPDDFEAMLARFMHTKNQRPDSWFDPSRGSVDERVEYDMRCQDVNRLMQYVSRFAYYEIDTSSMNWLSHAFAASKFIESLNSILECEVLDEIKEN
jgi:hypothetical protein